MVNGTWVALLDWCKVLKGSSLIIHMLISLISSFQDSSRRTGSCPELCILFGFLHLSFGGLELRNWFIMMSDYRYWRPGGSEWRITALFWFHPLYRFIEDRLAPLAIQRCKWYLASYGIGFSAIVWLFFIGGNCGERQRGGAVRGTKNHRLQNPMPTWSIMPDLFRPFEKQFGSVYRK